MIIYYSLSGSGSSQMSSSSSSCWVSLWGGRREEAGLAVSGVAEAEEVEEVEGETGKAGTLGATLRKYIVISVWLFAFSFLEKCFCMVLILPQFALVSVPVSQKGLCCKRSQKQSWIIRTLLPPCLMSICFLALLLLCLLPHCLPGLEALISI